MHASLEPPVVSDLTETAAALTNFGWFWDQEPNAAERNKIPKRTSGARRAVDEGERSGETSRTEERGEVSCVGGYGRGGRRRG